MNKKNQTATRVVPVVLSALILTLTNSAFANDIRRNDVVNTSEKWIEEYLEPLESDIFLEIVSINVASTIMIFDENSNLIYDALTTDLDFDPILEILLRRADFLMETDGTRYYQIYVN
ncbi:MAG: hypothetical protein O2887_00165 [Bacteroidetes bacterium]|nr:hypothetical protein [Bacteroidota bacterium]MDA1118903.1 hypothetical protein [Bacteroidota bacterium]